MKTKGRNLILSEFEINFVTTSYLRKVVERN